MSDPDKSAWQKVLEQLTDPWDWAAAALGASAGIGTTLLLHGADGGTSAAGGATLGISARKAFLASRQRARLRKRATGLLRLIERRGGPPAGLSRPLHPSPSPSIPPLHQLHDDVIKELELWEERATPDEEFSKQMDGFIQRFRSA